MKVLSRYLIFIFIASSLPTFAQSLLLKEVIENQTTYKQGSAKFSVLFWDIYQSHLWSSEPVYSKEDEALLLKIEYLRDITKDDLIDKTVEQWRHLKLSKQRYEPYVKKLQVLWPDIKKGDSLALLKSENRSVFYFNDQWLGEIDDAYFSEIFLAIWLSPNTSQPKLREQLIRGQS